MTTPCHQCLQKLQRIKMDLQLDPIQVARKLAIREKVSMLTEDQETSTIHQAKFLEVSPTNHTMKATMVTKARFTLWNKSIRHNSANITWTTALVLSTNSVNLLTDKPSWDSQTILFHKTSAKPLSALSIPTTRLNHASTWKKKANVHLAKAAHSSTTAKRRETWSTLFQIYQKEWHFHQCQKRLEIHTRADTTTTTPAAATSSTSTTQPTRAQDPHHPSAHSNSVHWTPNHHLSSRLQASPRWLLSVASIQTSTSAQLQLLCKLKSKVCNSTASHKLRCSLLKLLKCKSSKCTSNSWTKTMEILQLHKATKTKARASTRIRVTATRTTSSQDLQRRTLNTDMKRRKVKTLIQRLARKATKINLSRKSMWPSKSPILLARRPSNHQKLSNQPRLKNQPRPRLPLKLLTTPLPNEEL